jgi:hypothetical protein
MALDDFWMRRSSRSWRRSCGVDNALAALWMRISRSWRRCCGVVNALTASHCPMFFFVAEGTTTSARARLRLLLSSFAPSEDRDEGDQEKKTALETKDRRGDLGRESK